MSDFALYSAFPFHLNYLKIRDSSLCFQFTICVDILDVPVDCLDIALEYFSHVTLAQPERLILMKYFNSCFTVFRLIQQYLVVSHH